MVWLVEEARHYIPDSSKTAGIVDFVLQDFLDNPDVDDWERTRDRVYERYHLNAAENGFVYRDWVESSVNFAAGLTIAGDAGTIRRTAVEGGMVSLRHDGARKIMQGMTTPEEVLMVTAEAET